MSAMACDFNRSMQHIADIELEITICCYRPGTEPREKINNMLLDRKHYNSAVMQDR